MSVLLYGNEAMIWREKEMFRIRAVKMQRSVDYKENISVLNVWIRGLCEVMKRLYERVNKSVLQWFDPI